MQDFSLWFQHTYSWHTTVTVQFYKPLINTGSLFFFVGQFDFYLVLVADCGVWANGVCWVDGDISDVLLLSDLGGLLPVDWDHNLVCYGKGRNIHVCKTCGWRKVNKVLYWEHLGVHTWGLWKKHEISIVTSLITYRKESSSCALSLPCKNMIYVIDIMLY